MTSLLVQCMRSGAAPPQSPQTLVNILDPNEGVDGVCAEAQGGGGRERQWIAGQRPPTTLAGIGASGLSVVRGSWPPLECSIMPYI